MVHLDGNWLANIIVLHNRVGHDNGHLDGDCFRDVDDNLNRLGNPTGDGNTDLHGFGHTDLLHNFHRFWHILDLILDDLDGNCHWLSDGHANFIYLRHVHWDAYLHVVGSRLRDLHGNIHADGDSRGFRNSNFDVVRCVDRDLHRDFDRVANRDVDVFIDYHIVGNGNRDLHRNFDVDRSGNVERNFDVVRAGNVYGHLHRDFDVEGLLDIHKNVVGHIYLLGHGNGDPNSCIVNFGNLNRIRAGLADGVLLHFDNRVRHGNSVRYCCFLSVNSGNSDLLNDSLGLRHVYCDRDRNINIYGNLPYVRNRDLGILHFRFNDLDGDGSFNFVVLDRLDGVRNGDWDRLVVGLSDSLRDDLHGDCVNFRRELRLEDFGSVVSNTNRGTLNKLGDCASLGNIAGPRACTKGKSSVGVSISAGDIR